MAAFPHNAAPLMRILKVKVKPGAREEALTQLADGSWQASVKAPPVDGKANAALIALLAREWRLPKTSLSLESGATQRLKRIHIKGEPVALAATLKAHLT